jgi:lipid-A-disaccharide synthase-like uncharacterized protein
MALPAYWWLLALLVIIQGAFFVRMGILRMRRKELHSLSRLAAIMLFGSGGAGLVYGVVQRDPLFFLGQVCLLFLYHVMQKRNDDGKE